MCCLGQATNFLAVGDRFPSTCKKTDRPASAVFRGGDGPHPRAAARRHMAALARQPATGRHRELDRTLCLVVTGIVSAAGCHRAARFSSTRCWHGKIRRGS